MTKQFKLQRTDDSVYAIVNEKSYFEIKNDIVWLNQQPLFPKNEYDYSRIHFSKEDILALAELIKKEDENHDN